jgi:hypothetical protein
LFVSLGLFLITIFFLEIFSYRLSEVWAFREFFYDNFFGFFWLLTPEYLVLGIFLLFLSIFIYRRKDFWGYKWLHRLFLPILFTVFIFTVSLSYFVYSNKYNLPLYKNVTSTSYRFTLRDQYVKNLDQKNVYYGLVVFSDTKSTLINHGGVLHEFILPEKTVFAENSLVWVRYELISNQRKIVEYKYLA